MPAWPAYFFLTVSIPLLVPTWGALLRERFQAPMPPMRWRRAMLLPVAIALFVPLTLTTALPPSRGQRTAKLPLRSLFLPVGVDAALAVQPVEGGLAVTWDLPEPSSAKSFFIVYRSPLEFPLGGDFARMVRQGVLCEPSLGGAPRCTVEMDEIGRTREERLLDRDPPPGTWTYRIALAANWRDDLSQGDPFVLSRPLNVSVG